MSVHESKPRRRHVHLASGPCRSGRGCSRDDWLVTAHTERHRSWPREAWGTVHVKQNGEPMTACGLFAVGWPVFFGQTFEPRGMNACPHCAHIVSASLAVAQRQAEELERRRSA